MADSNTGFVKEPKILTLVLFLMIWANVHSQKLKTIKLNHDYPYSFKEVFQVLKSEKEIRHGSYMKKSMGSVIEKGQYSKNEKVGVWTVLGIGEVYLALIYEREMPHIYPLLPIVVESKEALSKIIAQIN